MRLKYNAASPNHRRVIPNPNPERTEEDPEELVWEASNNFIVEMPDGAARRTLDEYPGEFEEASEDEPDTRVQAYPDEWVEKLDTDEGEGSTQTSPESARVSRPSRKAPDE